MQNVFNFEKVVEHLVNLDKYDDIYALEQEIPAHLSVINPHQECNIDVLQGLILRGALKAALIFFQFSIKNHKNTAKYIEEFSVNLANDNHEALLYNAIKVFIEGHSDNLLLLKKAAYLSLYLGYLDDAYHWTVCLEIHTPAPLPPTRKRRLELYLRKIPPLIEYQIISGNVFFRSTHKNFKANDAPGEKHLFKSNNQRKKIIQAVTGWNDFHEGTLNLLTSTLPHDIKISIPACAYEPGCSVQYPENHISIPKKRIGYWYYHGFIFCKKKILPVLFRYPEFPANDSVLEIFSPLNLRDHLQLSEDEEIHCYFCQKQTEIDAWLECKLQIHADFSKRPQDFGRNNSLYQGHEKWGLPGQRPTIFRLERYSLHNWILPSHHILDIGCNIGCLGMEAATMAKSYTGFDNNEALISIARRLASHHAIKNCHFENSDFNEFLKRNKNKYNVIFSFAVHVWLNITFEEYAEIIKELLYQNGILVIESNNLKTNDQEFLKNMRFFIQKGFKIVHQGAIKDDEIIERYFMIFQLENKYLLSRS